MSLILVATVGGVLLERFSSVARRTDAWGYAGAEPGTRPATVRGPPTAVFSRPLCQTKDPGLLRPPKLGPSLWPGPPDLPRAAARPPGPAPPPPPAAGRGWACLPPRRGAEPFQSWEHGRSWRHSDVY